MENEEIDLLRLLEVVWLKKKQILFHTALAVICVGLVAYCIPRFYETHNTAFVYPAASGALVKQDIFPEEYYKEFARSPEVLNEVLQKLPNEIKLDTKISPLESLTSMLSVETKVTKAEKDLAGSALMVTYFVRHIDPVTTFQVARVWREILEEKMGQDEVEKFSRNRHEIETQFEASKARLETVEKKLMEREGVKVGAVNLESEQRKLSSIQRLISQGYADYEFLQTRMNAEKSGIAQIKAIDRYQDRILQLQGEYLAVKAALEGEKRLLGLPPQTTNPLYREVEMEIADSEFRLKMLSAQKAHLERVVEKFQGEVGKSKSTVQNAGSPYYRKQTEILKNNINRYEKEAHELNGLLQEKAASVKLFQEASKNLEEIKRLQPESLKRFSFAASALQPVVALGNPVKVGVFGAVIFGLPLAMILALLQVHFAGKAEEKVEKGLMGSQLSEEHHAEVKPFRSKLDEHEATTPSFSKVRNSRLQSVVESVSFAEER